MKRRERSPNLLITQHVYGLRAPCACLPHRAKARHPFPSPSPGRSDLPQSRPYRTVPGLCACSALPLNHPPYPADLPQGSAPAPPSLLTAPPYPVDLPQGSAPAPPPLQGRRLSGAGHLWLPGVGAAGIRSGGTLCAAGGSEKVWEFLIIRPSCFDDLDTVIMLWLHHSIAPAPPSTLPLTPCLIHPPTYSFLPPYIGSCAA